MSRPLFSLVGAEPTTLAPPRGLHPVALLDRWRVQAEQRRQEREMLHLGPHLLRDIGALTPPEDGSEPLLPSWARARLTSMATSRLSSGELGRRASGCTAHETASLFSGTRRWV